MNSNKVDNTKPKLSPLLIILLILAMGVMIYLTVALMPDIIKIVSEREQFRAFILQYGALSSLVFIGFQVLQVVVAAIPGEFIQFAGGYIFGLTKGTIFTVTGILLGTTLAFGLARLLGYPVLRYLIPEKSYRQFAFLLESKQAEAALFLLFLIPGIPKDVLSYMAGFMPIPMGRFLLLSTIARFPSNLMATYVGAHLQSGNYIGVAIISVIAVVIIAVTYFYRERIMNFIKYLK